MGSGTSLIVEKKRHTALVLDFGGGTFDVSVIDTTAQGDISYGGKIPRLWPLNLFQSVDFT